MSIYTDVEVEVSCDKCDDTIPEYRGRMYCGSCAGISDGEKFDTNDNMEAEFVKEWFDDNALILSKEQYAFGQIMLDSVRSGRLPVLK